MRRPKPGQEAIAAALQAIQRMAVEVDTERAADLVAADALAGVTTCFSCGAENREENRFCSSCGVPLHSASGADEQHIAAPVVRPQPQQPSPAPGQHHYHHHYHHHYFPLGDAGSQAPAFDARGGAGPYDNARVRAPLTGPALSRAEAAVRQLAQHWALACNTKQLDDVVSLYVNDALVLRANTPPIRGAAAIREFFFAALDSGLGEVELEPFRVELFGDTAYEAGRCKMLVPVAMGKRREERGKYLLLSIRQNLEWKIVADCWSSDLSLGENPAPASPKPSRK
jgi:uncharacterized protein (TIGR02246 family)